MAQKSMQADDDHHVVKADSVKRGEIVMRFGDEQFNTEEQETGLFRCSCGETFESRTDALSHLGPITDE